MRIEALSHTIDPDQPVSCSNCAACCCRLKVVLLPGDEVPQHYIDRDERDLEVMARLDDGWCVALDRATMRCTIYATRPYICRDYAMGAEDCLEQRSAWRSIPSVVIT